MKGRPSLRSSWLAAWLAMGIGAAVVLLAWFGFRASREWQRSSTSLVARRAEEAASLLVTALTHDMRAVQTSVLTSTAWDDFRAESAQDLTTLVGSAFARYPYPDAFVAWHHGDPPTRLVFFTRSDRPPAWSPPVLQPDRYPVRATRNEAIAAAILSAIREDAGRGLLLSAFELTLGGVPYQVVVRLQYRDRFRQDLLAIDGFMVNLPWVRDNYFPEIAHQMARIGGDDSGLALGIIDERGIPVVATHPFVDRGLISRRPFPVLFLDPLTVAVNPPLAMPMRRWTVIASGAADPALAAAIRGANRTVILAACAAGALAFGLVLTVRAVRASAQVSDMRAEFVSSVTHELKTPLASIRALGDTLSSGRLRAPAATREYALLVVQEAKRLSRLVDNLLAHARVTDIADVYSFEVVPAAPLIASAAAGFDEILRSGGFRVRKSIPPDLPCIRVDRSALELVLDNVIDNAVRYSPGTKELEIGASAVGRMVAITFTDKGVGIEPDEIGHVTQKFVRGRNATGGGSGLGLAIVNRIVADHQGTLAIQSAPGEGTAVTIALPVA